MSPPDLATDAYVAKLREFNMHRYRDLIDINLIKLYDIVSEIGNMPTPSHEVDKEFEIHKPYRFTRFLVKLAQNINTPTPNWKRILWILHTRWLGIACPDESKSFWGIQYKCNHCREHSFGLVNCGIYSDSLIKSNQTGVPLDRIMQSYWITLRLCNVDYMFNGELTKNVVYMFINQLYFDDYLHRNYSLMTEMTENRISFYDEDETPEDETPEEESPEEETPEDETPEEWTPEGETPEEGYTEEEYDEEEYDENTFEFDPEDYYPVD
jgi:hypothetical protein